MVRFLSVMLVRSNISSLDHVLEVAIRFSCKAIVNLAYHENIISCTASPHRASEADSRDAARELILRKRQGAPILLSEATYRYVRDWPDFSADRIMVRIDLCRRGPRNARRANSIATSTRMERCSHALCGSEIERPSTPSRTGPPRPGRTAAAMAAGPAKWPVLWNTTPFSLLIRQPC